MDFRAIIQMAMTEYMEDLRKATEDLTAAERRYQPTSEANHIDFTVWHMARVEDGWVQRFARQIPQIWNRDNWDAKLGLPERGSGYGYTEEQVFSLPTFDFAKLMAYYDAVSQETSRYLDELTEADLDICPDPRRPEYTVGKMFSHVIVEESQHVGHIAYLRGLQRGINA